MAATTYIVGNDGDVTIGTEDLMKVRSFAATLSRNSSDLTAFGDTGKRRKLGLLDLTGSFAGIPLVGTATNSAATSIFFSKTATQTVTLKVYTDGTNLGQIVSTAVFSSFAFNSDKSGDSTVTANFENANGSAPVLTWSL